MILKQIKPNYKIILKKYDDRMQYLTTSFYSEIPLFNIAEYLNEQFEADYVDSCIIGITFYRMDNKKIKLSKKFDYENLSLEEIKGRVLQELGKMPKSYDIKNTRYQINVLNKMSPQLDSKTFTFNSKLCFDDLLKAIKKLLDDKIYEINEEGIEFSNSKITNTTHYVTLFEAGSLDRRKGPSKSFSIYIPDYSSMEIIKMLKGESDEQ